MTPDAYQPAPSTQYVEASSAAADMIPDERTSRYVLILR